MEMDDSEVYMSLFKVMNEVVNTSSGECFAMFMIEGKK